jgi:NAD(P)-dependent dehydrogenase (short-subunit alcohol dehydrogenase family)
MRDSGWKPTERDVPAIADWNRLLDGKVAVVTGGGDGIGGAISSLFAAHGAIVEIAEIDADRAERARRAIEEAGGTARAHVVDVTDPADVERLAAAVLAAHGGIDVLVNNVGDYRPQVLFEASGPDDWKAMYDINLFHIFAVTRAFLGSMIERGGGSIVNFHSVEGMRGFPQEPVYAAMKAAAAHFTTSLAVGVGRHGIRVNGIGTDLTQTPQVNYLSRSEGNEHLWPTWAPVGRLGWPGDQARVALFLASDLSAYVTGHNVPVDGGTKAGGGWFWVADEGRFVNRPLL